jgi:hypothetical protein
MRKVGEELKTGEIGIASERANRVQDGGTPQRHEKDLTANHG